jgi:hypothetical protein
MKHLRLIALSLAYSLSPIANNLFAEQITMDLSTATDLNGNPITYSKSYGEGYYDLTDVWEQTYNDVDSCRQILVNDGVFRLSHLPSEMSYGGLSWEGFTLSTVSQDTANVLGCVAKGGLAGIGTPYVIGYYSEWVSQSQGYSSNIIDFNGEYYPEYVYICQNSNTMEGITNGVFNSRPLTQEDTLTLIIQALDSNMLPTATMTYYLAVDGKKNEGWTKVPLSSLGKTARLSFSMTSTDISAWGTNTPLYFALDALTINTEMPTALPNSPITSSPYSQKIWCNGKLLIFSNGQYYTILGIEVNK